MTTVPKAPTGTPGPVRPHEEEPPPRPLRLGGRTSHLARAYARRVMTALAGVRPDLRIEYVPIDTSADRHQGDLSEAGGKALFMKEIDKALLAGEIDAAVHCMKDVPADVPLPAELTFAAYLARDDVRDAVVFPAGSKHGTLDDLPPGARVGTSAVRRKAQLLKRRPDLTVVHFRGNVVPRLARLDEGREVDAIVLASGGLARLDMGHRVRQVLTMDEMCPAVGAGVVGVQCRESSTGLATLLQRIDHPATRTHLRAERAMLHALQGHCNSPIAGHCHTGPDGLLTLTGMVFTENGATFAHAEDTGTPAHARELGTRVAAALIAQNATSIIAAAHHP